MAKIKIYMAIPSTGKRCDAQMYALRDIAEKYKDTVELVYPPNLVTRIFHDYARNAYIEGFKQSGCDIVWFLDSDISPPTDILDMVVSPKAEWSLAGAPYPVFMSVNGFEGQQIVFTVYRGDGTSLYPTTIPQSGTEFVEGIATGCLFIKKEVIEKLEAPYFEFKYDPKTRELTEGEDLGFCKKVGELGYKFYVDYSMVCKHYKEVCLLEVNNYAISYSNQAVVAYDRAFRSEIAKKKLALSRPKSSLILP